MMSRAMETVSLVSAIAFVGIVLAMIGGCLWLFYFASAFVQWACRHCLHFACKMSRNTGF